MSYNSTSPASLFGGTWTQIKDKVLMSAGDTYAVGSTGGSAVHTHTSAAHTHTVAGHTHTTGSHMLTKSEIPNYKIGFLPVPVPGYHGEWENEGVKSSSMSTSGKQSSTASSIEAGATQYGWDIYTNGGEGAHNHGNTSSTSLTTNSTTPGNTGSSSNLPPYLTIYTWRRTA